MTSTAPAGRAPRRSPVIVLHEYGHRRHLVGLSDAADQAGIPVSWHRGHVTRRLVKAVWRRDLAELQDTWQDACAFLMLLVSRDRLVVFAYAPYHWMALYFLLLKARHRLVYFTSWPFWEPNRVVHNNDNPVLPILWRRLVRGLDAVSVNRAGADGLSALGARARAIPHAVELTGTAELRAPVAKPMRVLFVGRLVEEKGVLLLEECIEVLEHQDVDIEWTFAGDGPLRPRLEALAESDPTVSVLGTVGAPELRRLYREASLLVLPSFEVRGWVETFGIVVIEALASGLPVVASDCPGPVEVLEGTGAGVIVPQHDARALADRLARLAQNPNELAAMQAAAHPAAARFDRGVVASAWSNLLWPEGRGMSGPVRGPLVSVVLATYNGERFIADQLQSLVDQTHPIHQLVLTDDASTDATADILSAFAEQFPDRCLLLRNGSRAGVTKNFERGLERVTGDIVLLADQDDIWMPEKVASFVDAFESSPALSAVYCDAVLSQSSVLTRRTTLWRSIRFDAKRQRRVRGGDALGVLLKRTIAFGNVLGVRRDVVEAALPIPDGWPHDGYLSMIAAVYGEAGIIDSPLVWYRQHDGQQSGGSLRRGSLLRGGAAAETARWQALAERLHALAVPRDRAPARDQAAREATAKARHLAERALLQSRPRISRLAHIGRSASLRSYRCYSNGLPSLIGDLWAPDDRCPTADVSHRADAARPSEPEWLVLYRYSRSTNRKDRPPYFSKTLALASFVRSLQAATTLPEVIFIVDGDLDEPARVLMECAGRIEHIARGNNSRSYRDALNVATSRPARFYYMAEDDYLYKKDAFPKLFDATPLIDDRTYLTLYDHPDRYLDGEAHGAQLRWIGEHHWRSVNSTCMTFAGAGPALREDAWLHHACSRQDAPRDFLLWRPLVRPTGRPGLLRRRVLFGAVPSLATHLEAGHLAPGVDWDAEARDVREWVKGSFDGMSL